MDTRLESKILKSVNQERCSKCGSELGDAKYDYRKLIVCASCLLHFIEGAFKQVLRAECGIKRGGTVFVCFSGDEGSKCLWTLMRRAQEGLLEKSDRKLQLSHLSLLYVDIDRFYSSEGCIESPRALALRSYFSNLNQSFEVIDPTMACSLKSVNNDAQKEDLRKNMQRLKHVLAEKNSDRSVLADIESVVVFRSLFDHALRLSAKDPEQELIFLSGTTATRAAQKGIRLLCKGGGVLIPSVVGILDDSYGTRVSLARPLKRLLDEEVALYLQLTNSNDCVVIPKEQVVNQNSFDNLVESFVSNLQQRNPQSVSTVTQTFEKLSASAVQPKGTEGALFIYGRCSCCLGPKENINDLTNYCHSWSNKQLEILKNRFKSNSGSDAPPEFSCPPERQIFCGKCIRVAAFNQHTAEVLYILSKTSERFIEPTLTDVRQESECSA